MRTYLNELFKDKREQQIAQALDEIGNLADSDIRKRVDEFARLRKLPAGEAEELTALLINVARGARFHSMHPVSRKSLRHGR